MHLVYEALDEACAAETAHQEELAARRVLDKAEVKVGGWAGRASSVWQRHWATPTVSPSVGQSRERVCCSTHAPAGSPLAPPPPLPARPCPPRPPTPSLLLPQAAASRRRRDMQACYLYTLPLTPGKWVGVGGWCARVHGWAWAGDGRALARVPGWKPGECWSPAPRAPASPPLPHPPLANPRSGGQASGGALQPRRDRIAQTPPPSLTPSSPLNLACAVAGKPVEVYYNPDETVLRGRPEVYVSGSYNRWRHPSGGFPPTQMQPVISGGGGWYQATLVVCGGGGGCARVCVACACPALPPPVCSWALTLAIPPPSPRAAAGRRARAGPRVPRLR